METNVIYGFDYEDGKGMTFREEVRRVGDVPFVRQSLADKLHEVLKIHEKHTPTLMGQTALEAYRKGMGE